MVSPPAFRLLGLQIKNQRAILRRAGNSILIGGSTKKDCERRTLRWTRLERLRDAGV
jgi:hypothetical protein